MTDQHPITPPPELVKQWLVEGHHQDYCSATNHAIAQAARWGADQELEACCEWVSQWCGRWPDGTRPEDELRAARRPKPPSLAEEALDELDLVPTHDQDGRSIDADTSVIRTALERLKELEGTND